MGRETLCTPELTEEICQVLRAGNYITVACEYVGISARTYHYWCERAEKALEEAGLESVDIPDKLDEIPDDEWPYVSFFHRVNKARRSCEVESVARIRKAAQEGDWRADSWFLERSYHDRWGKQRVDVTSKNDKIEGGGGVVIMVPDNGRKRDNSEDE